MEFHWNKLQTAFLKTFRWKIEIYLEISYSLPSQWDGVTAANLINKKYSNLIILNLGLHFNSAQPGIDTLF